MLHSIRCNRRIEDVDIRVIGFSKDRGAVSVFNSDDVAARQVRVFKVNRVTSKGGVLLDLRRDDVEEYLILGLITLTRGQGGDSATVSRGVILKIEEDKEGRCFSIVKGIS